MLSFWRLFTLSRTVLYFHRKLVHNVRVTVHRGDAEQPIAATKKNKDKRHFTAENAEIAEKRKRKSRLK